MSVMPPSSAADGHVADPGVAAQVASAARQLVRAADLEEALAVAASAIGDATGGEAVLRVTATPHDLHAGASGVVPPSALSPVVRSVLAGGVRS